MAKSQKDINVFGGLMERNPSSAVAESAVTLKLDVLGLGSVIAPNMVLTEQKNPYTYFANSDTTIHYLSLEFLEELSDKRPILRGKIDDIRQKWFIWDNFRSDSIHVGPVLDIYKSYRYEKVK